MPNKPEKEIELDRYLANLKPETARLMIAEIERAKLAGTSTKTHKLVLERARTVLRRNGKTADRIPSPMRLVYEPLDPFLTDYVGLRKQPGRIARSSLESIRIWITRDLAPLTFPKLVEDARQAIVSNDAAWRAKAVLRLQKEACDVVERALVEAGSDERRLMKLKAQLSGDQVLGDARDMVEIFKLSRALVTFRKLLPDQIIDLTDNHLGVCVSALGKFEEAHPGKMVYALVILEERLSRRSQLLRIAVLAAGSQNVSKIARQPARACLDLVLYDAECEASKVLEWVHKVEETKTVLKHLSRFFELINGVGVELDIPFRCDWSDRLNLLRRNVSEALERQIREVPRYIKTTLRLSRPGMSRGFSDPLDIKVCEHGLALLGACRRFRSQLALNQIVNNVTRDANQILDAMTDALLNAARRSTGADSESVDRLAMAAKRYICLLQSKDQAEQFHRAIQVASGGTGVLRTG